MGCRLCKPVTACIQAKGLKLKMKKAWDIAMFLISNVGLNAGDIVSDGTTAYALSK